MSIRNSSIYKYILYVCSGESERQSDAATDCEVKRCVVFWYWCDMV